MSAAALGAPAAIARESRPQGRRLALHLLAGSRLDGIYRCTSWWAIQRRAIRGDPMRVPGAVQNMAGVIVAMLAMLALGGFC